MLHRLSHAGIISLGDLPRTFLECAQVLINGQTGSYSGIQETRVGHFQFDSYAPIKRQFSTGLRGVKAHQKLGSNKGPRIVSEGH